MRTQAAVTHAHPERDGDVEGLLNGAGGAVDGPRAVGDHEAQVHERHRHQQERRARQRVQKLLPAVLERRPLLQTPTPDSALTVRNISKMIIKVCGHFRQPKPNFDWERGQSEGHRSGIASRCHGVGTAFPPARCQDRWSRTRALLCKFVHQVHPSTGTKSQELSEAVLIWCHHVDDQLQT